MTSDRSLLERCLKELERPGGDAPALVAALRDRLQRADAAQSAIGDAEIMVGAARGASAALPGHAPAEGPNTLWETNQPVRTEEG